MNATITIKTFKFNNCMQNVVKITHTVRGIVQRYNHEIKHKY